MTTLLARNTFCKLGSECLPAWQRAWRTGFAPFIATGGLEALRRALWEDDRRLIQNCTTQPPPLCTFEDCPAVCGCALAICGMGEGLTTVGQLDDYFHRLCRQAEEALGWETGPSVFLNYFDDTPRERMRAELLEEVSRELERRQESEPEHEEKLCFACA
jgi:hypothetical protein